MGNTISANYDKIPPIELYKACAIIANYVTYKGNYQWDFSRLHEPINSQFTEHVQLYLDDVLSNQSEHKGWKLPETTFIYPWLVRMFPDAKYIIWVRDPRDVILGGHQTDRLREYGINYDECEYPSITIKMRAASWKYQWDIIEQTPKPKHFIIVRYEDFVTQQDKTLKRLEEFLGFPLARIPVFARIGRWKTHPQYEEFNFLHQAMRKLRYL